MSIGFGQVQADDAKGPGIGAKLGLGFIFVFFGYISPLMLEATGVFS